MNNLSEFAKSRLDLEIQIEELKSSLYLMKESCKHNVIAKGYLIYSRRESKIVQTYETRQKGEKKLDPNDEDVGVSCQDCGYDFGWYCSKNPNNIYCEYTDKYNTDICVHCGQPDERK